MLNTIQHKKNFGFVKYIYFSNLTFLHKQVKGKLVLPLYVCVRVEITLSFYKLSPIFIKKKIKKTESLPFMLLYRDC